MYLQSKTLKTHICLTGFLILMMTVGCIDFDQPRYKACDYCILDKPTEGEMVARVTITKSMPSIPISVYRGDYEKGDTVLTFIAETSNIRIFLPVDKQYTLSADYRQGGKSTIVIDSDKTTTGKVGCYGDDGETITHHCWYIDPGIVDLRLKDLVEEE